MAADDMRIPRKPGQAPRPGAAAPGRREPSGGQVLDLLAIVVARGEADDDSVPPNPEHRKLLALCQHPVTVADLVADMELTADAVRALLADLIARGRITVATKPPAAAQLPAIDVLKETLKELREL